ncbi:MAG TPA: ABC transporter permease [Candidatus Polarisedimenticolia bacterium]|nr:ABC transporter permease [Candidatus Polarisedimenticolia bacterium]
MFDLDTWQEIFDTIRANRMRAFLTAFSVAWGIFMLIVLLGSGQGLSHGVAYQFRDDAVNSIWVRPGQTSTPYKGMSPGRRVQMTNEDHDDIEHGVRGVDHITARYMISGNLQVRYRDEAQSFDVRSVHPGHLFLEKTIMTEGRFINPLDISEHRKVAVVGEKVAKALFHGDEAVGKEIEVNGVAFKVVGRFTDEGGEGELEKIYLPISTAQRAFGGANRINQIMMTTGTAPLPETEAMAKEVRRRIAERHAFSVEDPRALYVNNSNEDFARFMNLMSAIRLFVWVVGLGTILAGVVGVSNIMMISVRERTREIGVRRALGATPWSVVSLILKESILITSIAGYVGLVLGIGTLEIAGRFLPKDGFFIQPEVDLLVAVQATVLLIVAGALAGFFPARRAGALRPVEALRSE